MSVSAILLCVFVGIPVIALVMYIGANIMYIGANIEQWFRDRAYEGSAEDIYDRSYRNAYTDCKREMEHQLNMFVRDFENHKLPEMLKKYDASAKLIFSKDAGFDLHTGEPTMTVDYLQFRPVALRVELRPSKEFVERVRFHRFTPTILRERNGKTISI